MKRPPLRTTSSYVLAAMLLASGAVCSMASRAQALPTALAPSNPFQAAPPTQAPAPAQTPVPSRPSKPIILHTEPTLSPAGALYNAALNDYKAGHIDSAVAKLRQFAGKYPKDATARGLLGFLELRQGQGSPAALTQASRDLAAAVAIDPKNRVNRSNYAAALLQQKQWAAAVGQLRAVAQTAPGDVSTQMRLAGALGELGRTQEASALYAKIVQSPNCPPFVLIQYGITVAKQQKPAAAAILFDRAARLEPTNAAAWNDAGICYERAGDDKNAVRCLARAVKLGPTDPFRTRFVYATALAKTGHSSEAIQQFRYITSMQPTSQPAWFNLGLVNDRAGHIDDALAAYGQARQLDPSHIPTLLNTCRLLIQKGQTPDAVDLLVGASQAQPKVEVLHAALGAAYLEDGKRTDASSQWQTAVALNPADSLTRSRLAQLELDQSQWAAALAQFDIMLKAAPESDDLLNGRGEALERLQRYPEALASLQRAVAVNPKNAVAWNNLGTVQESLTHKTDALADYRKAAALSPSLAEARENINRLTGRPATSVVPGGIVVRPNRSSMPGMSMPPVTPTPAPAAQTPAPAPSSAPPVPVPAPSPAPAPAPTATPSASGSGNPPPAAPPAAPQASGGSGTINP